MSADELVFLSLHELSRLIGEKKISPREAVEAHLRRIEALNPRINAFITVCAEEATEDARTRACCTFRRGRRPPP